jgi:hypothetical protein
MSHHTSRQHPRQPSRSPAAPTSRAIHTPTPSCSLERLNTGHASTGHASTLALRSTQTQACAYFVCSGPLRTPGASEQAEYSRGPCSEAQAKHSFFLFGAPSLPPPLSAGRAHPSASADQRPRLQNRAGIYTRPPAFASPPSLSLMLCTVEAHVSSVLRAQVCQCKK